MCECACECVCVSVWMWGVLVCGEDLNEITPNVSYHYSGYFGDVSTLKRFQRLLSKLCVNKTL